HPRPSGTGHPVVRSADRLTVTARRARRAKRLARGARRGRRSARLLRRARKGRAVRRAACIVRRVIETFCRRLQSLVDIDSPSGGREQERVATLVAGWLEPLGCTWEWVEEPDGPARSMVVRMAGEGARPVALLGHTDT